MWKTISLIALATALIAAPAQKALAVIACPVMLISGDLDRDGIHLSFRNKGKLPIEQLELTCTPFGKTVKRSTCRQERGLFYPGNQYALDFLYPNSAPQVSVTVRSALLSDGTVWAATRHESCRPLKVTTKSQK